MAVHPTCTRCRFCLSMSRNLVHLPRLSTSREKSHKYSWNPIKPRSVNLPKNKVCSLKTTVQAVSSRRRKKMKSLSLTPVGIGSCCLWGGGKAVSSHWQARQWGLGIVTHWGWGCMSGHNHPQALRASCFPVRCEECKRTVS